MGASMGGPGIAPPPPPDFLRIKSEEVWLSFHTHIDRLMHMTYGVEMGSGAMIHTPSFIKISSGIQKFTGGIHRQESDLINPFLFFQIRKVD
jgi:hypothetical protein